LLWLREKLETWGFMRKLTSRTANLMAATVLRVPAHDMTGTFRCFKREVLENLELDTIKSNGYSFFEEVLFRVTKKNYKIAEVPIKFMDRQYGKSKLSKKEIPKFVWMLIRLRLGLK
ncbi:MAG: polyprenol monophosphomannose synthase, partial [Candidatus Nanoarchaeia archaeon]